MSEDGYQLPDFPEEIKSAYRAAHRALEGMFPEDSTFVSEVRFDDINEVISQFPFMASKAEMVVESYRGPEIMWKVKSAEPELDVVIAGVDLDAGRERSFGVELDDSAFEGDGDGWPDSSLDRAARIYKRETGWDFPPGKAGVWLLALAPESAHGSAGEWSFDGYLAGFVILYDRDKDGRYDSVGHMWTARGWRRKGIAVRLLTEAKSRFGYSKIEKPLTKDSAALLEAHPEFSC